MLDLNDDIIPYGPYDVVQLAYTFNAGNGFTAAVALENPVGGDDQFYGNAFYTLDDYTPNRCRHRLQRWLGRRPGCRRHDAVWENFAVKGRVDVNVTEALSFMLMGAWADKDEIVDPDTGEVVFDGSLQQPNCYGGWGGEWAIGVALPGRVFLRPRLQSVPRSAMTTSRISLPNSRRHTSSFPASQSLLESPTPTTSATHVLASLATSVVSVTLTVTKMTPARRLPPPAA